MFDSFQTITFRIDADGQEVYPFIGLIAHPLPVVDRFRHPFHVHGHAGADRRTTREEKINDEDLTPQTVKADGIPLLIYEPGFANPMPYRIGNRLSFFHPLNNRIREIMTGHARGISTQV